MDQRRVPNSKLGIKVIVGIQTRGNGFQQIGHKTFPAPTFPLCVYSFKWPLG